MERHSYRTLPSLSVSHNILFEKTMKPLTVRFVGTWISNFEIEFSCYLYLTQYVHLIHHIFPVFIFFSQNLSLRGLGGRSTLIHNIDLPLSEPKKLETTDCGRDRGTLFLQKGLAPRLYGGTEFCFNYKYYKLLLRIGKERRHGHIFMWFQSLPIDYPFLPSILVI